MVTEGRGTGIFGGSYVHQEVCTWSDLTLTTPLCGKYHYFYFTTKETRAQRS